MFGLSFLVQPGIYLFTKKSEVFGFCIFKEHELACRARDHFHGDFSKYSFIFLQVIFVIVIVLHSV